MARVISSAQTFFYKFVFPIVWIGGFGAGTVTALLARERDFPWAMFPVSWVLGSAFIYWLCGPLKKVTRDSEGLAISNFFREVRVQWRDVTEVSGSRMINPPRIKLSFKRDVGFGSSIIFMPKVRFLWPFQEHPAAQELRDLIRENRGS